MKRVLAVFLIICMALSMAACTNKGGKGDGSSVAEEESSNRYIKRPDSSSKEESTEPESSSQPEPSSEASSESEPSQEESKPESKPSSDDEHSGIEQESSSEPEESSSEPEESSSKPEESSSEPEESSSEPEESSSEPEEESSKPEEKPDYDSYTFPDWYDASDEETTYIIAQTIEAYLYENDMETCLEHLVTPVEYDWKTIEWYVEENKEIYLIQPKAKGGGENYIPTGINTTGYEYAFEDYFGRKGICCGPWKTPNVLDANYFTMTFTMDGIFQFAYGRMYSEFYGGAEGSYAYDKATKQIMISIIDGVNLVYDVRVFYNHIILIQRSEDGLINGDQPGWVYVLTMQEAQG